jgi:hypothetical protein
MFTLRSLFLVIAGVALFCGGWAAGRTAYDAKLRETISQVTRAEDRFAATLSVLEENHRREIQEYDGKVGALWNALKACQER